MAKVGRLSEFDVQGGNWTLYAERMDMFFKVNEIKEELKVPTLISVVGDTAYELMVNLCSPGKPSDKSYAELVKIMETFLQPKPSMLAERYRFRQCKQNNEQSVAQYVAQLKKMARYCEFGANYNENMRDQFVCGIQSDSIREKLFAKEKLEWEKALGMALSLEAAERDAHLANRSEPTNVSNVFQLSPRGCSGCGDIRHTYKNCRFQEYVCSRCNKKGHLRRVCRAGDFGGYTGGVPTAGNGPNEQGGSGGNGPHSSGNRGRQGNWNGSGGTGARPAGRGRMQQGGAWAQRALAGGGGAGRSAGGAGAAGAGTGTHWVQEDEHTNGQEELRGDHNEDDEEPMYQMSLGQYRPVSVYIKINNQLMCMEVDTGSAISCISEQMYKNIFSSVPLQSCDLILKFYDGTRIRPVGLIQVNVEYGQIQKILDLYVISSGTTCLLGRQWLAELNMEIPKINVHNVSQENNEVEIKDYVCDVIFRYRELFKNELGCFTGERAALRLRAEAVPVFCRARPLPYALRERVDAELDNMLAAGVIEPVDHSDWATPLVIVHKPDGSLRLCADFKITLNRVLLVDRYPVPKIEDLLSKLSGSNYFTKLDLSQAYNQILLREESRDLTVINTHRGLFKYNRLVFGLSSSPGIFQRIMSNLLKDIPNVTVFLDDICIGGKTKSEHMKSVEAVLEKLYNHGLRIKKQKCEFCVKEVNYLGFIINENGIRVDPNKIKPILSMCAPTNTTELKSFIGMIIFYGKFIKNLSSLLSPFYELLKKHSRWVWSKQHQSCFEEVKKLLSSSEVLAHYDPSRPLVVTCDASAYGLGAVLAQLGDDGSERVIAYASRALTPAERLPNDLSVYWHQYPYSLGIVFCKLRALISEAATYVSVLTISAFSLERYLAICHPLHLYAMAGLTRASRIILALWLVSVVCAAPIAIYTDISYRDYPPNSGNLSLDSAFCALMAPSPLLELSSIFFFFLPAVLILCLYVRMGLHIRSTRVMEKTKSLLNGHVHGETRQAKSRKAIIRMLAAVVIAFFLCWAPFHIQRVFFIYGYSLPQFHVINEHLFNIAGALYYVSATVNPILYNVMSGRYRLAFRETLLCRKVARRDSRATALDLTSCRDTPLPSFNVKSMKRDSR